MLFGFPSCYLKGHNVYFLHIHFVQLLLFSRLWKIGNTYSRYVCSDFRKYKLVELYKQCLYPQCKDEWRMAFWLERRTNWADESCAGAKSKLCALRRPAGDNEEVLLNINSLPWNKDWWSQLFRDWFWAVIRNGTVANLLLKNGLFLLLSAVEFWPSDVVSNCFVPIHNPHVKQSVTHQDGTTAELSYDRLSYMMG